MTKVGLKTKKVSVSVIEFEHLGTKREALLIMPYGIMANVPNESFIASFCQDGNDDSQICYPFDSINIDELEENEVAFGIPTEDARIKFKEDGTINIRVGETDTTDYAVRFNELEARLADLETNINTITVDVVGVQAGASTITTSVPKVPSNVDFSNCKVSKINVPAVVED